MLERTAFPLELHLAGSQATMQEGLDLVRPHVGALIDGLDLEVVARGRDGAMHFRVGDKPLGPPAFAEYFFAMLWGFVRALAPGSPPPTLVRFAHRWPRHGEATRTAFGGPVRFGCRDVGFDFLGRGLHIPIPTADPELGKMLAESASDWLASRGTDLRVRDRARHWLASNLAGPPGDEPLAARLAEAMRLSERSLRRKLHLEGTSLRELVAVARRDRAVALLEAGELSLDAIAAELGFSSANAFGRAFRAWTGVPPSAYAAREIHPSGTASL
jgi:AraC-like DNA-binding protein